MTINGLTILILIATVSNLKSQSFGAVNDWSNGIDRKLDAVIGIENTGLLRGTEYKLPSRGETTHPFFESQAGALSKISFKNGDVHYNVPLIYDLYQKQIALRYLRSDGRMSLIQLDMSKISALTIFNHDFRSFQLAGGEKLLDVLFDKNEFLLLAERVKTLEVESPTRVEFASADVFYWVEKEKWFPLKKSSDFFQIAERKMGSQKFQRFLKEHNIKSRKVTEREILEIALFLISQS